MHHSGGCGSIRRFRSLVSTMSHCLGSREPFSPTDTVAATA
jgi:hypothetical protein